jgi:hypothetical protein
LEAGGVNVRDTRIQKTVDHAQTKFAEEMRNVSNSRMALSLFRRAERVINTTTKVRANRINSDIVMADSEVPDAYSNNSYFQLVFLRHKLHVFKHPQDLSLGSRGVASIRKDVDVSEILFARLGNHPDCRYVRYHHFAIDRIDKSRCEGSISLFYPMTLARLARPVPVADVVFWGRQILSTIEHVHAIGYSINDLKPNNLFLDSDGNCHIADYGGVTELGADLVEFSMAFMPHEFYEGDVASPVTVQNDKYCLISTLLCLLNCLPRVITKAYLISNCKLVGDNEFANLIKDVIGLDDEGI